MSIKYAETYFTLVHHYRRVLKSDVERREFARRTLIKILNDPSAPKAIKTRVYPILEEWSNNVGLR